MKFIEGTGSKKYLLGGVAVALLIAVACMFSVTTSYSVVIDGKTVGQISSASTLTKAMADAKEQAQKESGMEISDSFNTVEAKASHSFLAPKMSNDELAAVLKENVDWLAAGAVLNINNGDSKFVVANEADGQAVLDALMATAKENAGSGEIKSVEFMEEVSIDPCNVKVSEIQTKDAILKQIQEGKQAVQTHVVADGESFWTIAQNSELTVDELQALNPEIVPEKLQIGQEITLTKQEALVNVVVTREVTVEEVIKHETEYKDSKSLLKGESKVVTEGADGKKNVTYEIKEANGSTIEKNVVKEVVVAEPVTEVVNKGTRSVKISSRSAASSYDGGNGVLSWPKSGSISSPYGPRSRGFHSGIDITAKVGEGVYASAGGTVELASWYYGYGNCIVINHGNGMKTRYAHLSAYNCSVGQTVSRGELIGKSGNTGNSTGPHLHFEVIVNGSTKNPVNYLR